MKMKRITLYSLISFLPPFIFSIALFYFFVFWGIFIEKMSMLSKYSVSFGTLFSLVFAQAPYITSMTIPIASMSGAFFSFKKLMNSGEWKAFLAAGWSPFSLIAPLLKFSIIIAIFHFCFSEFLAAPSYARYNKIYREDFRKKPEESVYIVENPVFKNGDVFFLASLYDGRIKSFFNLSGEKYLEDAPVYAIYALSAVYENGLWILKDGLEVKYENSNPIYQKHFELKKYPDLPPPSDLVFGKKDIETMDFFSLGERILKLKKLGLKQKNELIFFWSKLSSPVSSFVMILGAAVASMLPWISGGMLGAGVSLFFGFLFWNFSLTFQRMAEIETISPFWGAFATPIIFTAVFIILLKRMRIF